MNELMARITASGKTYQDGDCGDLAATIVDMIPTAAAIGVMAYDGDVVHVIIEYEGVYYDGLGCRDVDDIKADWAYDRAPELVTFVALSRKGGAWEHDGQPVATAHVINL